MKTFILFAILFAGNCYSLQVEREPRINFANYHVIEVVANTQENLELLQDIEQSAEAATAGAIEFWTGPVSKDEKCTMSVHPELVKLCTDFFDKYNFTYTVLVSDLQELIDEETRTLLEDEDDGLIFRDPSKSYYDDNKFNRLNQITMHMRELQEQNPQTMTIKTLGTTSEGRPIQMAVLSNQVNIFIEFCPILLSKTSFLRRRLQQEGQPFW